MSVAILLCFCASEQIRFNNLHVPGMCEIYNLILFETRDVLEIA